MGRILIKAIKPHRQKILVDGKEMKLQQWANRKAAATLRDIGGDVQGEQFTNSRDNLMRDAVMNPENYGIKFVDREPIPFEGQELTPKLSTPDIEAERAEIDEEFAPDDKAENKPEFDDDFDAGSVSIDEERLADWKARQGDIEDEVDRGEDLFDEGGKLREGLPEDDDEDPEEEHLRRIMTSHNTAFRDAWSILKSW